MQSILVDFLNLENDDFLFILPIKRLTIHHKSRINNFVLYPAGSIDIDELLTNHAFLGDNSKEINIFKENTLIVLQSKSPVKFSAAAINNRAILDYAIAQATPILDFIIFEYCNLINNKTLPGRVGQTESGESFLLMFNGIGSPFTRIVREKIYTNTITYGHGLNIDESGLLNSYRLLKSDVNDVGNIAKHALRMYTQIVESNSNTEKFIYIIRLFEFIASPDKYEKFQSVKTKIINHVAQNKSELYEISENFKYYTSGRNENGLRTQIIHKGKRLEELIDRDEIEEIFIKLHKYLFTCITDLLDNYNKKWDAIEQLRENKKKVAEKNNSKSSNDNYASTIVFIDGNFLSESIKKYKKLYSELYPNKRLEDINLVKLCYEMLLNTRHWEEGKIFGFLIFYSGITKFPLIKHEFRDMDNKEMKFQTTSFEFHTFPEETIEDLFSDLVRILEVFYENQKINDIKSLIDKAIFCGDDKRYENILSKIDKYGSKDIVVIKDPDYSEMNLAINYFNVGHLVGKALGLKSDEL